MKPPKMYCSYSKFSSDEMNNNNSVVDVDEAVIQKPIHRSLFSYFNSKFISQICNEWLDATDICRFDTSISCRKSRQRYLYSICKHLKISFGKPFNNCTIGARCMHWLDSRNIDARVMDFEMDFHSNDPIELKGKLYLPSEIFLLYFRSRTENGNSLFRRTKSLSFLKCNGVIDEIIVKACKVCPILQKLNLSGCRNISNVSLICVSIECPELKELNLFNCTQLTDTGILSIADGCKNLTYLNIGWCDRITDQGITCLASSAASLTELDLAGCTSLTNKSLKVISEECPLLQRLNISYNSNFSDAGLTYLSQNSKLKSLRSIHMGKCSQFSEDGLAALAEGCCSIEELDLYSCEKITDFALTRIVDHCLGLSLLNISHCYQITDIGLVNLAEKGKSLKHLFICGCDLLTGSGLEYFQQRNPSCMVKKDY